MPCSEMTFDPYVHASSLWFAYRACHRFQACITTLFLMPLFLYSCYRPTLFTPDPTFPRQQTSLANAHTPTAPSAAHLTPLTAFSFLFSSRSPLRPARSIASTSSSLNAISPTARYRSRRSFRDEVVITIALPRQTLLAHAREQKKGRENRGRRGNTYPFARLHASKTCSGSTLSRFPISATGLSTGPPWRDVKGIKEE